MLQIDVTSKEQVVTYCSLKERKCTSRHLFVKYKDSIGTYNGTYLWNNPICSILDKFSVDSLYWFHCSSLGNKLYV